LLENTLLHVIIALGISVFINLILKKYGISQIVGYILTGTIITYTFGLSDVTNSTTLDFAGEFGIVFLMFTIGLEISLAKMNTMKKEIFGNGLFQVIVTSFVVYLFVHYIFNIETIASLIISMAFALSSTAVVLSYLKSSKEIYSPYGQRATGILVFQDIAVIPILILIGFLTNESGESLYTVLSNTFASAIIVIGSLFIIGKRVMSWLLHFSASSNLEELFMSSVLFIVIGASSLAHYMGFSYSLGAFVAGMIIAETKYHHKVESDIAPFKDILLGIFFITVGMKIDIGIFIDEFSLIIGCFLIVLVLKSSIIYGILRYSSSHAISLKTALALSQVGEFSFVIFSVAGMGGLIDEELAKFLVLIVIFSMIVTPFFITKIHTITSFLSKKSEEVEADMSALQTRKNHIIVCGYSIVGKFVSKYLEDMDAPYIVVDNSYKHVKEALDKDIEAYLGDASKISILNALHIENASAVIITLDNINKKRLICEAILKYTKDVNLIVKVVSMEEKEMLKDLDVNVIVDGKEVVAKVLVDKSLNCQLR